MAAETQTSDELIAGYIDGTNSPEADRRLQAMIRENGDFMLRLKQELQLNDLIDQAVNDERSSDAFVHALRFRLGEDAGGRQMTPTVQEAVPGLKVRRWVLPLAAAAGVAIMVGAGWLWNAERETRNAAGGAVVAKVEEANAECGMRNAEGSTRALKAGDEICDGARIETGNNGKVKFTYLKEGTTIELNEKSRLVLGRVVPRAASPAGASLSKTLRLESGRLVASVAQQPVNMPMTITTPHAEMVVKGTVFSVAVSDLRTRLKVDEGQVDMKMAGSPAYQTAKAGGVLIARPGVGSCVAPWQVLKTIRVKDWKGGEDCSVAVGGEMVWLRFDRKGEQNILRGLDPETGSEKKRVTIEPETVPATTIVCDGMNFWSWSKNGELWALDMTTGRKVRGLRLARASTDCPFAMGDGFIWVWRNDIRQILKFGIEDGKLQDSLKIDAQDAGRILRITYWGGTIYLGSVRGNGLLGVRASDGTVLWRNDAGSQGFGEMAMDPKRGLWFTCSMNGLLLLEADLP
ncbi:MAG: hypothetical protein C0404_07800 [Verrucomicrobia bacterium]|nr:hypothetical protein [Verrucomicrobiota bacterium]